MVPGGQGRSGREGGSVAEANTDHETPALQLPWVKPAHPICMHQLCKSLWLSVTSSSSLYQSQQCCSLQKTWQNKGLPIHLLLSGFPPHIVIISAVLTACCGAWAPDQVAHCLCTESYNCLLFIVHLLPLMPNAPVATCNKSFLELRKSFTLFLPLPCLSQLFTPAAAWELLLRALDRGNLNPPLPPQLLSWQLSLSLWFMPFMSAIRPCPLCL